jgi:hypothetical protein
MEKTVWIGSLSGPNLKSKTCTELSRSIQNRKWRGIVTLGFTFVMCGAMA